jgi:hypothetical protein
MDVDVGMESKSAVESSNALVLAVAVYDAMEAVFSSDRLLKF